MIIGLVGYGQVGKDTVGRLMVENHGFKRVAFADKLKELALKVKPFLDDRKHGLELQWYLNGGHYTGNLRDWDYAKQFPEVREFLQNLGVACREVLHPDVWVHAAFNAMTEPGDYVITDVRFINEAEMLRKYFVLDQVRIVRIWRPEYGPLNEHVSEHELDKIRCDHNLVNDGTIEDLERKVRALVIDDTVLV